MVSGLTVSLKYSNTLSQKQNGYQDFYTDVMMFVPEDPVDTQITKFMGPTWGPPGPCWPQMVPMLAP